MQVERREVESRLYFSSNLGMSSTRLQGRVR